MNVHYVASDSTGYGATGGSDSCGRTSPLVLEGTESPLSCDTDTWGGHFYSIAGGGASAEGGWSFGGQAIASLYPEPPGTPSTVQVGFAQYYLIITVAPGSPGDSIKFTVQDTETCRNTIGPCNSPNVVITGATNIKGKPESTSGATVTATGPVTISLGAAAGVNNSSPNWMESLQSAITVTPISEKSK